MSVARTLGLLSSYNKLEFPHKTFGWEGNFHDSFHVGGYSLSKYSQPWVLTFISPQGGEESSFINEFGRSGAESIPISLWGQPACRKQAFWPLPWIKFDRRALWGVLPCSASECVGELSNSGQTQGSSCSCLLKPH